MPKDIFDLVKERIASFCNEQWRGRGQYAHAATHSAGLHLEEVTSLKLKDEFYDE